MSIEYRVFSIKGRQLSTLYKILDTNLGFTLIELLVTVVVLALVGGILGALMVNNAGLFYRENSKVTQGVGANDAFLQFRSQIKEAQAVAVGYPVSNPTYTSGNTQLVLRQTSIDASGNIIANTYDYVVFSVTEGRLSYQVFPDAASTRKAANVILAKNVTAILFQYFDATGAQTGPTNAVNVKMTLTLSQKAGQKYETQIATSEANLRNN